MIVGIKNAAVSHLRLCPDSRFHEKRHTAHTSHAIAANTIVESLNETASANSVAESKRFTLRLALSCWEFQRPRSSAANSIPAATRHIAFAETSVGAPTICSRADHIDRKST